MASSVHPVCRVPAPHETTGATLAKEKEPRNRRPGASGGSWGTTRSQVTMPGQNFCAVQLSELRVLYHPRGTPPTGVCFISYIASRWTIIKDSSSFQSYAVPWDCGFVIPWLFSPSNCYFPFQTRSHKMESGGGSRPPPPSLALTSHHIARHRIGRYHMLRGCSAAPTVT